MASEAPPRPFEGEILLVMGHVGPRPAMLVAVHHVAAPGGPATEISLGGMSPGRPHLVRRVLAATTGPDGRASGLKWYAQGSLREVHWDAGGLRLWAGIGRAAVPARLPRWVVGDQPGTGLQLPARALVARFEIEAPDEGPLARFAGRRRGFLFSTARLAADPPWRRIPIPKRVEAAPEAF